MKNKENKKIIIKDFDRLCIEAMNKAYPKIKAFDRERAIALSKAHEMVRD